MGKIIFTFLQISNTINNMKKLALKLINFRLEKLNSKASLLRESVKANIKREENDIYFSTTSPSVVGLNVAMLDDTVVGVAPRVSTKHLSDTMGVEGLSFKTQNKLRKIQEKIWKWEGLREKLAPFSTKTTKTTSLRKKIIQRPNGRVLTKITKE